MVEDQVLDILSRYIAPKAAANLLERAMAGAWPRTPGAWARFLEERLWPELVQRLPFREMPPELKALIRRLKEAEPPPPAETPLEEAPPQETVDLEDPSTREALAQDLARLEGVRGVVVAGPGGRAERLREEAPLLETVHLLLQKEGYASFFLALGDGVWLLRNLGQGYIGLIAEREANIGRLLYQLRRLKGKEEA